MEVHIREYEEPTEEKAKLYDICYELSNPDHM